MARVLDRHHPSDSFKNYSRVNDHQQSNSIVARATRSREIVRLVPTSLVQSESIDSPPCLVEESRSITSSHALQNALNKEKYHFLMLIKLKYGSIDDRALELSAK